MESNELRADFPLPDLAATEGLGRRIASGLRRGDVVALQGALGAGKTTLARAILRALGIGEAIPSPSFTLVQSYDVKVGGADLQAHHFDLYRIEDPSEVEELGLDDALETGIALIEWPERASDFLPAERLSVALSGTGAQRHAAIEGPARWAAYFSDSEGR